MGGDDARSALADTRFADVRWVAETGSTNSDLLEAAHRGEPEGVVLVADHQTAGRGRLGRVWQAPPGSSLLCSVLLRPVLPADRLALVTMAMGIAAADACREVAGVPAALKWPNDLVVTVTDGSARKLAGMLAESSMTAGTVDALVVGIGINVAWPPELPPDLSGSATALNHVGGAGVERTDLLVALLRNLDREYEAVGEPTALRDRYVARSATIGQPVRVETATGPVEGEAVGVDDDGSLLIDAAGAITAVRAGDVTLLRPRES